MKPLKTYIPITSVEACIATGVTPKTWSKLNPTTIYSREGNGEWGLVRDLAEWTVEAFVNAKFARLEERMPNEVPEGVPPLPEPFLAFIGKGPLPKEKQSKHPRLGLWIIPPGRKHWEKVVGFGGDYEDYAVDVRTDYAKEHWPELVEAMEHGPKAVEVKRSELRLQSGEGTVTFEVCEGGIRVSVFEQSRVSAELDWADRNKLERWLASHPAKHGPQSWKDF